MVHLMTIQKLLLLVLPAVALDLAKFAPGRRVRGLMVGSHGDASKKVPNSSKSMKGSKSKASPKGPKGSKSKKGKGPASKAKEASKSLKGSSKIQVGSGQAGGKGDSPGSDHGHGGGAAPVSSSKNPVSSDDGSGGGSNGGGGSGGGSGGTKSCQNIPITFYRSDIPIYYKEGAVVEGILVGGLNSIPFYSTNSGDQLGTYSDGGVRYGTTADDECVVTGAFNFYPFTNDTKSDDQVNVAFTCRGTTNSVTGGTGKFHGATGYEEFGAVDEKVVEANLVVCMCCGPSSGSSSS